MAIPVQPLTEAGLEALSRLLGDTSDGLTGSEIGRYLHQANITDISPSFTKWQRLYNAFVNEQNKNHSCNKIFVFIHKAVSPQLYTDNKEKFEDFRTRINKQLLFVGYEYTPEGKFRKVDKATTIDEIENRVKTLKGVIESRNYHGTLLYCCRAELLQKNYFHAVFEAHKGLIKRIQDLSGSKEDGNKLMEYVFSSNPVLIINNFQTRSEKDENTGFGNLLKGLCGMFRNPEAHELKVEWDMSERDAIDILGMISYCHRRLDNVHKIR